MESEHVGPFNLGNPGEFTMLELAQVILPSTFLELEELVSLSCLAPFSFYLECSILKFQSEAHRFLEYGF